MSTESRLNRLVLLSDHGRNELLIYHRNLLIVAAILGTGFAMLRLPRFDFWDKIFLVCPVILMGLYAYIANFQLLMNRCFGNLMEEHRQLQLKLKIGGFNIVEINRLIMKHIWNNRCLEWCEASIVALFSLASMTIVVGWAVLYSENLLRVLK